MKVGKRFQKFKKMFGEFLEENRRALGLSNYDVGYTLGVSHMTCYDWEKGDSFPSSIVRLKKLHLLFENLPEVLVHLFHLTGIAPTSYEWQAFKRRMKGKCRRSSSLKTNLNLSYKAVDSRDDECRVAFGSYLRKERLDRGIQASHLARALGVSPSLYFRWESGSGFPQNPRIIMLLDRFYGNVIKVLFGLCKEGGIHLSQIEIRDVMTRFSEFENTSMWETGKSKPPAWEAYIKRRRLGEAKK
jgi:transcriptional regulator with XRE-family HTH domain